ncbi:MAG TPA: class I SAM-dependent methyltransferase [Blastocatellia bacterium]|nr:class I SAM-dependent methyltransferase [Blastocatellia bacterium]
MLSAVMSSAKELAYRYDLFIAPDWRDRFDTLINESIELPTEGRILDVNCGTGEHAIELAERMRGKGEVIGIDPSAERVDLARAKAQAKKTKDVAFEQGVSSDLPFDSHQFDAVISDASMVPADEIEDLLAEMVRVAQPDGSVILKMATHGSFDEFFSIYWEALHDIGIDNEVWSALEGLINERSTVSDAESMAERSGLRNVRSFVSKEEFSFETAKDFLESPLIKDAFLAEWIGIVPEPNRDEVLARIVSIIERERRRAPFEISIKATVIAGEK